MVTEKMRDNGPAVKSNWKEISSVDVRCFQVRIRTLGIPADIGLPSC